MPVEPIRGCGYRTIKKLYLTGWGLARPCDRLPLELVACPCCGERPRFHRGISQINALILFDTHKGCSCDPFCPICFPKNEPTFLMWVGSEYSKESFLNEARELGISKAIPFLPKHFKLGESWVFLAKKNYLEKIEGETASGKKVKADAIFYAFQPLRLEMLITESDATEEKLKELEERDITPIIVPDDDHAHLTKQGARKAASETRKKQRETKKRKPMKDLRKLLSRKLEDEIPVIPHVEEEVEL